MKREIRMIAADLDGTMMDDQKRISARNWEVAEEAAKKGILFVPATGRTRAVIPAKLKEHPHIRYGICSDGASVVDLHTGEILYRRGLKKNKILQLLDLLDSYDVHVDVFADGRAVTQKKAGLPVEDFPLDERMKELVRSTRTQVDDLRNYVRTQADHLERLNIFYKTDAVREELLAVFRKDTALATASSIFHNLEVSSREANKGNALRWLAQKEGIPMEAVLAIGDSDNDISMLREAGVGIAMGNALPEVKAAANSITRSNEEEGFAEALEKYLELPAAAFQSGEPEK